MFVQKKPSLIAIMVICLVIIFPVCLGLFLKLCKFITLFYRSESPCQVYLVIITWLYETLKDIPTEEWHSVILAYDNMCHIDALRAARIPLPLPPPFHNMWKAITKVQKMCCTIKVLLCCMGFN